MTFAVDPKVILESAARGDAWYPYAARMPIPEADTQRTITSRLLILHSMAGPSMTSLDSIYRYYKRDDVHTESTFGLAMTGQMAQFVQITVRADCNASANGFATSVETQDLGSGFLPTTLWTPEQVEQLAGLAAWMHLHPNCDLPLVSPAAWDGSGVGYHSQHARWSIFTGKTCPGQARIAQMPAVRARAIEIVIAALSGDIDDPPAPTPVPQPDPAITPVEDDDMSKVTELVSCKGAVFAVVDNGVSKWWIDDGNGVQHVAARWKDLSPGIYVNGQAVVHEVNDLPSMRAFGPVSNYGELSAAHPGQWDRFGFKA